VIWAGGTADDEGQCVSDAAVVRKATAEWQAEVYPYSTKKRKASVKRDGHYDMYLPEVMSVW
jgi:hypothetical protein